MEMTTKPLSMTMMYNQLDERVRIMYTFNIGDSRNVCVNEDDDVTIADENSGKRAFFVDRRWVRFVQEIPNIDRAIQRAILYKPTNFQYHLGGQWYVRVSDWFHNIVDIRRWYIRVGFNSALRPTIDGISLTYTQWENLKKAVKQMNELFPQFAVISTCHHVNQRGELHNCCDCNPIPPNCM